MRIATLTFKKPATVCQIKNVLPSNHQGAKARLKTTNCSSGKKCGGLGRIRGAGQRRVGDSMSESVAKHGRFSSPPLRRQSFPPGVKRRVTALAVERSFRSTALTSCEPFSSIVEEVGKSG